MVGERKKKTNFGKVLWRGDLREETACRSVAAGAANLFVLCESDEDEAPKQNRQHSLCPHEGGPQWLRALLSFVLPAGSPLTLPLFLLTSGRFTATFFGEFCCVDRLPSSHNRETLVVASLMTSEVHS